MSFPWLKGHGTENDFVLLPDHDGTIHGELDAAFVAALCHRRRGIGADGVMRVVRTAALGEQSAGEWFMDYKNADGSVSEMCGNGIRVFALHLVQEGLADPAQPLVIGTRDGDKTITFDGDDQISVDMGTPELRGVSKVTADGRTWEAQDVRTGNPHAVAFVERLTDAGSLLTEPDYDKATYPEGVNIEFVVREGAAARRDARARTRLRRDPLLWHRRLCRRRGDRARRRRSAPRRPTASTCPAAPST